MTLSDSDSLYEVEVEFEDEYDSENTVLWVVMIITLIRILNVTLNFLKVIFPPKFNITAH